MSCIPTLLVTLVTGVGAMTMKHNATLAGKCCVCHNAFSGKTSLTSAASISCSYQLCHKIHSEHLENCDDAGVREAIKKTLLNLDVEERHDGESSWRAQSKNHHIQTLIDEVAAKVKKEEKEREEEIAEDAAALAARLEGITRLGQEHCGETFKLLLCETEPQPTWSSLNVFNFTDLAAQDNTNAELLMQLKTSPQCIKAACGDFTGKPTQTATNQHIKTEGWCDMKAEQYKVCNDALKELFQGPEKYYAWTKGPQVSWSTRPTGEGPVEGACFVRNMAVKAPTLLKYVDFYNKCDPSLKLPSYNDFVEHAEDKSEISWAYLGETFAAQFLVPQIHMESDAAEKIGNDIEGLPSMWGKHEVGECK